MEYDFSIPGLEVSFILQNSNNHWPLWLQRLSTLDCYCCMQVAGTSVWDAATLGTAGRLACLYSWKIMQDALICLSLCSAIG